MRAALPGDLAGVEALHGRSVSAASGPTWAEMLATPNLTVYVAVARDGSLVGTMTLLVMPNLGYDCHPTAFVESVVVDESWRRQGVGRALFARLLADAAARSCRKVQLVSHRRHREDGAFAFYAAIGFTDEADGLRMYLPD